MNIKISICILLLMLLNSNFSFSSHFYVNNVSGKDTNSGLNQKSPWKSIAKVESMNFQPGDTISFACGSKWEKADWEAALIIDDNGTLEKPIVFNAYGEGEKPTFSNGGQKWNKGIKVTAKYIVLENLRVTETGYSGIELDKEADFNRVENCEISNCGVGIWVYGKNNLLTKNLIRDLKMIVDDEAPDNDFGCVAFWIYGPNNEISYNRTFNTVGHSYDYTNDGGFIEFYGNSNNTYAHHNWVEKGNGICEGSLGTGKNIVLAYNVFIEHKGMFAFHTNNFALENFRFENNTCITREGTRWNNMFNWWQNDLKAGMIVMKNNIFVLGGSAQEVVSKSNNFVHENNIYYLVDGATLGDLKLGPGEILADPRFVDEENKDFRLKAKSPARDAGANLGHDNDFEGRNVPVGNAVDIGAFEFDETTGLKKK